MSHGRGTKLHRVQPNSGIGSRFDLLTCLKSAHKSRLEHTDPANKTDILWKVFGMPKVE